MTAHLHLQEGAVLHRVGFLWTDGWLEVVADSPDIETAKALFYAAQATAACFPTDHSLKAV